MAIAGLTDQRASFIELGRIRKDSPKKIIHKNGRDIETVGDDLDHFRVTFREDPVSQAAMENFQQSESKRGSIPHSSYGKTLIASLAFSTGRKGIHLMY